MDVLTHTKLGTRTRLTAVALGSLIFLGSQVMWVGIPAGWLWIASRASSNYVTVYGLVLIAVPPSMGLWGWLLHRLNASYLRTIGAPMRPRRQSAWLRPISGASRWKQPSSLLENSMAVSVTTSIVAVLLVFLLFPYYLATWP